MHKGRMEAFSDGVIAIIITIMVLEMKVPHEVTWSALLPLLPVFGSYVLSFVVLGIWWTNHHHLLQVARSVDGSVLWANLHLLFWLSLMPFVTGWMGENHFDRIPDALYGFDLLMCGVAYYILARTLIRANGAGSPIAIALGGDFKGRISVVIYAAGIVASFFYAPLSIALYVSVAVIWLIPDRRMARVATDEPHAPA
jgi:uncharacterized membrane protein